MSKRTEHESEKARMNRLAYSRKWYHEHKEYMHEYYIKEQRERDHIRNHKTKALVLGYYSKGDTPSCCKCGETDIRVLQLDHIFGDGAKERKLLKKSAGWSFYTWVIKQGFPEKYQTLCANCNLRKQYDEGILRAPPGQET